MIYELYETSVDVISVPRLGVGVLHFPNEIYIPEEVLIVLQKEILAEIDIINFVQKLFLKDVYLL